MTPRWIVRDAAAAAVRGLPPFRGKGRLGDLLHACLVDDDPTSCVTSFTMRDGSLITVDLRSRMESRAFWTGEYGRDSPLIRRLARCLLPGSVVLDVGANIGFYSIPLGRRLKQIGGTLYAFEPVESNYRRLSALVRANGLDTTVKSFKVALGDREGLVSLALESGDGAVTGNAVMSGASVPGRPSVVSPITTLDAFGEAEHIERCDLAKVDIEGSEFAFLKGGERFLRAHRPLILVELHKYWMDHFGWSIGDLEALASEWRYSLYWWTRRRFVRTPKDPTSCEHALFLPEGQEVGGLVRRHLL